MKYTRFAVVLAALIPSQVYAQNTQFSDCRTLEPQVTILGRTKLLLMEWSAK